MFIDIHLLNSVDFPLEFRRRFNAFHLCRFKTVAPMSSKMPGTHPTCFTLDFMLSHAGLLCPSAGGFSIVQVFPHDAKATGAVKDLGWESLALLREDELYHNQELLSIVYFFKP